MRKVTVLLMLAFLPLLFAVGCGDDDSGDSSGVEGTGQYDFKAHVHDFVSDTPVPGAVVKVVDNETGQILEQYGEATSDPLGVVEFKGLEDELVGFLCVGAEGEYVDTYQFDIDASAQDEKLWWVDEATYNSAPLGANITDFDPTLGTVAGAVYYREGGQPDGAEQIAGCTTIETVPSAKPDDPTYGIRYFSDARLPASLQVRDSINPRNGYFIAANIPIQGDGKVLVQSFLGDMQIGETTIFCKSNSIVINNIYVDQYEPYMSENEGNPMPQDCD